MTLSSVLPAANLFGDWELEQEKLKRMRMEEIVRVITGVFKMTSLRAETKAFASGKMVDASRVNCLNNKGLRIYRIDRNILSGSISRVK